MKSRLKRIAFAVAIAFLALTILNASWIAPEPKEPVKLIAHRGLAQEFPRAGVDRDTCTATLIEQPYHDYLENTLAGVQRAFKLGVSMAEVDIAPTSDGELVLFHDWTLDCRTDGSGPVRDKTLAELKALDIGHGYTADGGKTYPFRGKGVGQIPEIGELLSHLYGRERLMFNFKSDNPAEADLLAAKLKEAGRDPVRKRDAFYGHPAPVARIRELYPDAWAWSVEGARQCSSDYVLYGWTGYLPQSCRGETMVIPLNRQYAFWGWPNRLIDRMDSHGGHVIVTGPQVDGEPNTGLILPEQFTQVPSSFNGYIWIEDAFTMQPALRSGYDDRTVQEWEASEAALKRRRAARSD